MLPADSETASSRGSTGRGVSQSSALWKWGPFGFRPLATYGLSRADGLQRVAGVPVASNVHSASLGSILEFGSLWRAQYTASWTGYSHPALRDGWSHQASMAGNVNRGSLSYAFMQTYNATDSTLLETATQTKREAALTHAAVAWSLNPSVSLRLAAEQQLNFVTALSDTLQWSLRPEVQYHPTPRLSLSLSVPYGYVLVYDASNSYFWRPSAGLRWELSDKTALDLSAGVDRWTFTGLDAPTTNDLFYQATFSYAPFAPTSIDFSFRQGTSPSPFRDQISMNQSRSITLRQRLLKHLQLSLAYADRTIENYSGITATLARRIDSESYTASLSTSVLRQRGSISVTYSRTKSASSVTGLGLDTEQYGIQLGFRY